MKLVIQRVDEAKVTVDEAIIGRISKGLLILVGVSDTDTTDIADKMLDKALKMRIFDDESGKTNLSLSDVGGELLLVSQFTLYANCKKGHRPSFMDAGKPEHAKALYEYMLTKANDYCCLLYTSSTFTSSPLKGCNIKYVSISRPIVIFLPLIRRITSPFLIPASLAG